MLIPDPPTLGGMRRRRDRAPVCALSTIPPVLPCTIHTAWRAASWEQNKHDLKIIYEDFLKVNEANKKDAMKDEDGNGIADVDELDATRYFLRKVSARWIPGTRGNAVTL